MGDKIMKCISTQFLNLKHRVFHTNQLDFEKITRWYILLFSAFILIICSIHQPAPTGEWDDYFMPTVTLTSSHPHVSVYQDDIERAAHMYPQWANWIHNNMKFSPFKTKGGGMIPWYFPTYGIVCIPLATLLPSQISIYSFTFTNFIVFALMLAIVFSKMKKKMKSESTFVLILLITLNPIIFYFNWISAEVFIYSLLASSLSFWYCKEYKKTALLISIAGSMNPVIMLAGIALIVNYFYDKIHQNQYCGIKNFVLQNFKETFLFGCCFLYSLLPFIYSLKACGRPFVLISGNGKTSFLEMPRYFFAYFFDLNYGFLPYFNAVFICCLILFFVSIFKRQWQFTFWMSIFFCVVFGYCRQAHINCGVSGISRYNIWSVLIALFAFSFYLNDFAGKYAKTVQKGCVAVTSILSFFIIANFSPILAQKVPYTYFTPIARFFLDNIPSVYNPLFSTFYNRTVHVDDDYHLPTPICYVDNTGAVRKILATKNDSPNLNSKLFSQKDAENNWLKNKINSLKNKPGYISIPSKYTFLLFNYYNLGEQILFYGTHNNSKAFIEKGLSGTEENFTWTEGNQLIFQAAIEAEKSNQLTAYFDLAAVFTGQQTVNVTINESQKLHLLASQGESFKFDFTPPEDGKVRIEMEFPDAKSPSELGMSGDTRKLALAIKSLVIQ